MRVKGAKEKLEHFSLLVEEAAVCTLRIRFGILPNENDEPRMHHVMSADRQTKIVDWHNDTRMRLQEKSEILVATNTERG